MPESRTRDKYSLPLKSASSGKAGDSGSVGIVAAKTARTSLPGAMIMGVIPANAGGYTSHDQEYPIQAARLFADSGVAIT